MTILFARVRNGVWLRGGCTCAGEWEISGQEGHYYAHTHEGIGAKKYTKGNKKKNKTMEVSEVHRERVFYEQRFGKPVTKNIFRFFRCRLGNAKEHVLS